MSTGQLGTQSAWEAVNQGEHSQLSGKSWGSP